MITRFSSSSWSALIKESHTSAHQDFPSRMTRFSMHQEAYKTLLLFNQLFTHTTMPHHFVLFIFNHLVTLLYIFCSVHIIFILFRFYLRKENIEFAIKLQLQQRQCQRIKRNTLKSNLIFLNEKICPEWKDTILKLFLLNKIKYITFGMGFLREWCHHTNANTEPWADDETWCKICYRYRWPLQHGSVVLL